MEMKISVTQYSYGWHPYKRRNLDPLRQTDKGSNIRGTEIRWPRRMRPRTDPLLSLPKGTNPANTAVAPSGLPELETVK